jgi:hypothetical protein
MTQNRNLQLATTIVEWCTGGGSGDGLAHAQCGSVGSSVSECKLDPVSTRQPIEAVQLFACARFKLSFEISFTAS